MSEPRWNRGGPDDDAWSDDAPPGDTGSRGAGPGGAPEPGSGPSSGNVPHHPADPSRGPAPGASPFGNGDNGGGNVPTFAAPQQPHQQPQLQPQQQWGPAPELPTGGKKSSFPWLPLGVGVAIALVVVLVLNLTGAPVFRQPEPTGPTDQPTGDPTDQPSGPAPQSQPCEDPAAPSDGGSSAPQPTPEPPPPANYPRLDAGVVAPGKPATTSGLGNYEVDYRRAGDILTAYEFDCPDCKKKMRLYDRGNDQQLISFTTPPFSDSWVLDRPVRATSQQNSMVVEADGHWTLTVRHATDLPAVGDKEAGKGQAIINVSDGKPRRLDFRPYDKDDSLSFNVVDAADGSNGLIGCIKNGAVDVANEGKPYLLLLSSYGSWRLYRH